MGWLDRKRKRHLCAMPSPNRFLLLLGTIVKEGAVSAQAVERQSCVSTFRVRFRSFMMLAQVLVLGALMNLQIPVGILTLDHP